MNDPRFGPGAPETLAELEQTDAFVARHIGTTPQDQAAMLEALGYPSRAALIDAIVPESIRRRTPLGLPPATSEAAFTDSTTAHASAAVTLRPTSGNST